MTTRTIERCRAKCGQYWPLDEETSCDYGQFQVFNNGVDQHKDWIITSLVLSDSKVSQISINDSITLISNQLTTIQ
jgi:tyrosine-protein phosphatase non-receptor type 9